MVTKKSAAVVSLLVSTALGTAMAQSQSMSPNTQPSQTQSLSGVDMQHKDTAMMGKADADMQQVLDAHAGLNPKPINILTPAEARQQATPADAVQKILQQKGDNPKNNMALDVKDFTIPSAAGAIPARIYKPQGKALQDIQANEASPNVSAPGSSENEALPVIVYYHGGGWVIADLDTYDASARALAEQTNAIVVSSHYRQAPEHKFPAAHEDAFTAYQWAIKNAMTLGGDPLRIAVVGESAGGNLAINVSMMARDHNIAMPLHQVLIYPVAGVDMNTPSYLDNANAKPLNKPMMDWFMQHVLANPSDKEDPRLDIIGRANLRDLPRTTIITAEIDPLRSEGHMLAAKLEAAGVPVNLKDYEGAAHEFFGMAAVVEDAKDAQAVVATDLRSAFKTSLSMNQ